MSGTASMHSDLYLNSIPAGSPYGRTDNTVYYPLTTVTLEGCIEMEDRMHVYEVIAVDRRTFDVHRNEIVVAPDRDKALIRAAQNMKPAEIDDWHIEVRKLFSFEPIEDDK